ncbi:MAG TPA: hypothetical protein VFY65_17770 [Longimicrobium sp.]|nr:hypothetical protein [Longimicrobium sp.]
MNPVDHLISSSRGRRPWTRGLPVATALVIALVQAVPAAAQKGGASASNPDAGCTVPFPTQIPAELRPFVLPGTRALCAAAADLNGDGLRDYVLVLEKEKEDTAALDLPETQRPLLVVVGQPGGTLHVAARNDRVVYCADCGGVFGDPFEGVDVGPGTFTVLHYGGSAWRWRTDYTFRYAPQARTWRLTKVGELSYHTSDPDKMEQTVFVSPDDFGDIDLADFHPEHWRRPFSRR